MYSFPYRSLETPVVLEDRSRLFREKNDMIKDILLSSLEDILEENYRYNNRRKRMFFRYPAQTTLTSYVLNSVTVTNTFTPNGVDCPPPGYMICWWSWRRSIFIFSNIIRNMIHYLFTYLFIFVHFYHCFCLVMGIQIGWTDNTNIYQLKLKFLKLFM